MARRSKPEPASQQSVDRLALEMGRRFEATASQESVHAVKSSLDRLALEMGRRFEATASQESVHAVKSGLDRLALEMDLRFEKAASQESVDAIKTVLDRHIASMDRVAGELLDNRRSLLVFDSMLGDHRRRLDSHDHRLTSLESRPTPPSP